MRFNLFNWFGKTIGKEEMIDKKPRIKCALVIGHKKTSPGAYNKHYEKHEFCFNENLSKKIEEELYTSDKSLDVFRVYRRTYSSLPKDINELNPDFIISLHCNAFNRVASGSEVLFYHRSHTGKKYAKILQDKFIKFLELNDRGIVGKTSEDRGGYLLKNTNAPCIIAEPFFIDNDEDYKKVGITNYIKLIKAYCEAISEIHNLIKQVKS